jgi:hypothetical protein
VIATFSGGRGLTGLDEIDLVASLLVVAISRWGIEGLEKKWHLAAWTLLAMGASRMYSEPRSAYKSYRFSHHLVGLNHLIHGLKSVECPSLIISIQECWISLSVYNVRQ